jgi:hypothetical protein
MHFSVLSLPRWIRPLSIETTCRRVTLVRGDDPKSDAVERLLNHVSALSFNVAGSSLTEDSMMARRSSDWVQPNQSLYRSFNVESET